MSHKLTLALILSLGCYAPQASAIIVGGTNPNDPLYLSGNTAVGFSNVPGAGVCSGTLLNTGMHFLTAAHCILGASGNATVSFINSNNVQFNYSSTLLTAHPDFNPANYFGGNDIAVITLGQVVDASIDRLSLYTGTGETGQVVTLIGRGGTGVGATGGISGSSGTRREGTNTVDTIVGNNLLLYDFDDGSAARNTLGSSTMTARESIIYFGDSGGPSLIDGRIAGVHSFITCVAGTTSQCASGPDLDGVINGTFGERFGDTRVSFYAAWIQSITGPLTSSGAIDPPISAPEPSTIAAGCIAALICFARYRKTRNGSAS